MPSDRAAPPVKGRGMNSTGRGLCLVKSSTEEETQSLQARRGGLDRNIKRAASLNDVNTDMTEIARQPLEMTHSIRSVEANTEEYIEEMENETETMIVMDEVTAQFRISGRELLNSSSVAVLSGTSWTRVRREGVEQARVLAARRTRMRMQGITVDIMRF